MSPWQRAIRPRLRSVSHHGFIGLIAAFTACGGGGGPAEEGRQDAVAAGRGALEAERRANIRQFWKAYRGATDLRVRGEAELAARAYEEALGYDPNHEDALYYLGNTAFDSGQYAKAEQAWRQLVEVDPLSSRAHAQLGALYYSVAPGAPFDLARAHAELTRSMDLNREETGPLIQLGEVALLSGDMETATEFVGLSRQANPFSSGTRYLEGYLAWRSGDVVAAVRHLTRAVELSQGKGPASESASNEGATSRGMRPMLEGGVRFASPLSRRWFGLESWNAEEIDEAAAAAEYTAVQQVLARLEATVPATERR